MDVDTAMPDLQAEDAQRGEMPNVLRGYDDKRHIIMSHTNLYLGDLVLAKVELGQHRQIVKAPKHLHQ